MTVHFGLPFVYEHLLAIWWTHHSIGKTNRVLPWRLWDAGMLTYSLAKPYIVHGIWFRVGNFLLSSTFDIQRHWSPGAASLDIIHWRRFESKTWKHALVDDFQRTCCGESLAFKKHKLWDYCFMGYDSLCVYDGRRRYRMTIPKLQFILAARPKGFCRILCS